MPRLPDPGLHHWSWLRAGAASRFSLTGVTHTLCSYGVMQGLEQLVTAPLEPWDSLICTSKSALQVVQEAMSCMHERLERRFQQTLPPPKGPQLSLIPLGIDPEPYHWEGKFANRQEQRLQARQQLGISSSARVVLFLGRLSFHSKAHPYRFTALSTGSALNTTCCFWSAGTSSTPTSKRPTTSWAPSEVQSSED